MKLTMKDMLAIREVLTDPPEMRHPEDEAAVANLLERIGIAINTAPSHCPVCGGDWSCGH